MKQRTKELINPSLDDVLQHLSKNIHDYWNSASKKKSKKKKGVTKRVEEEKKDSDGNESEEY